MWSSTTADASQSREVRADPRRHERVRERGAPGRLDVEADREPAGLGEALDQLLRHVREKRAGGVVEEDPRRADLPEALRLLHEPVGLAGAPGAVDQPDVELPARTDDRLPRLTEVGDVVERVVKAEDVDPVLGRAGDEAADDVGRDGLGADEKAAPQGNAERRRGARVDRADPLPRALDPAAHRRRPYSQARFRRSGISPLDPRLRQGTSLKASASPPHRISTYLRRGRCIWPRGDRP